jgi:hypothetical protein
MRVKDVLVIVYNVLGPSSTHALLVAFTLQGLFRDLWSCGKDNAHNLDTASLLQVIQKGVLCVGARAKALAFF